MIYHQTQTVRLTAGADLKEKEGCFVTLTGGKAALTAAGTAADAVFGLLHAVDEANCPVDVILPGHAGVVGVRLHASNSAVAMGDTLVLAASGTVNKGSTGTKVAVALQAAPASSGRLIEARLVEPTTLTQSQA